MKEKTLDNINCLMYNVFRHLSAGVAQLVEQLICNQQVVGSSPIASSNYGWMPEWLKGADCKSAGSRLHRFESYSIHHFFRGVEQLVARRAHNPKVVGSSPTPATMFFIRIFV